MSQLGLLVLAVLGVNVLGSSALLLAAFLNDRRQPARASRPTPPQTPGG